MCLLQQGVEMGRDSEIGTEVTLSKTGSAVEKLQLSGGAIQITEGTMML